ncbi:MAG: hypothetical protein K6G16_08815 [Lachnospiraceae bacterium]|nr:hypothetical protein [Lachnospiraceae bacterium]
MRKICFFGSALWRRAVPLLELVAVILFLSGCGAAGGSAHRADQGSAVDQVLAGRAADADAAEEASRSDLILTPKSVQDKSDDNAGVDAEILALARDIAEENGITDEALTGSTDVADWKQIDLSDAGNGFTMAQMPEDCDVDVDLTILNSTMVYSEVYNMMYYPEKYIGKSVRMRGTYSYYQDQETGKSYLACFISDAAACCQQGIEFELKDAATRKYPDDYPQAYDDITVVGIYDTYEEDGFVYCTLRDAVLEEM